MKCGYKARKFKRGNRGEDLKHVDYARLAQNMLEQAALTLELVV
jgi:hypothetical protein